MEHDNTPNYKMIPGSREKNTPGTFRDTIANKYMEAPTNDGHSPVNDGHSPMDMRGGTGKSGKQEDEKKKKKKLVSKAPKRPLNPFSKEYTGFVSGSNPYIRRGSPQKAEAGTIFGK